MKHIRLVCTAKKIDFTEIEFAENYFKSQGFKLSKGKNLHNTWKQFAGTDEQRASDLSEALKDESVDIVWFARGGYGSLRVWKLMDKTLLKFHNKTLVGYSDMTVWLNQCFINHIPAVHATMPISFKESTIESLDNTANYLLKGTKPNWQWQCKENSGDFELSAKLFGGNLSLLYSLTGTQLMALNEGVILMIEDLEEYYYACDRMLINLSLQPIWKHVRAVVLGGFTSMHDNETPFGLSIAEMIESHSPGMPVVTGAPYGHQSENLPWLVGEMATIKVKGGEASLA